VATGRFQLSVVVAVVVLIRISRINTSKESTKQYRQENTTSATVVLWVCREKLLLLGMSVLCQRVFLDTGYWVLVQPFAEVR
jgi:hypothetical protein